MAEQPHLSIKTGSAGKLTAKNDPLTGITPSSSTTMGMSALDSSVPPITAITNITTPSTSPADDINDKQSIPPGSGAEALANPNTTTRSAISADKIINKRSISPTANHLAEYMSKTRMVLAAIANSIDVLDKSMEYVATVGPAIKASEELEKSRSGLQKQREHHQAELDRLETDLAAQLQSAIKDTLRKEAVRLVKQKVREELDTLLHLRIPAELYELTQSHPLRIATSRVHVHSAEARARNTSIQSGSEPLHPLWLPTTGKPHPLFPHTVRICADLSDKDIDTLLKEYDIMQITEKPLPAKSTNKTLGQGSSKADKVNLTREEKINIFMAFIGVTLRVMRPTLSSTASGKEAKKVGPTVMIINSCC
ncbi:hypothetical protein D9757_006449 [Collybiopsis confluens]|uniref:Uncharacterized protein n=1 Tax=Collybiopsis confluens TaxID=2823264 RepID=A0A8H5HJL9_9AGAR|nr:hypothetical protein D9757_006449 [Collybiopsis confluens]